MNAHHAFGVSHNRLAPTAMFRTRRILTRIARRSAFRVTALATLTSPLAFGACSSSSANAPANDVARTASLPIGQEVMPQGSALGLTLLAVQSDSRCPKSVQCVRLGDATILLGVRQGMGPTVPITLRWGAPPSDTLYAGVRLVFDSLTPWPAHPGTIPAAQYRAWVSVKRAP